MTVSSKMILVGKTSSLSIFNIVRVRKAVIPPHDCRLCVGLDAGKKAE